MPVWARLITWLAALRVAAALALFLSGSVGPTAMPVPIWIYVVLAALFLSLGAMLVVANRHDARAEWLGGVFLLLTAPLSPPVFADVPAAAWAIHLRPDSFLPAFLWRFVTQFPSEMTAPAKQRLSAVVAATTVVGAVLFFVNVSYIVIPIAIPTDWRVVAAAGPRIAQSIYWRLVLGLAGLAIFFLLWRFHGTVGAEHRRLRIFVVGLSAGVLPLALQVLLEQLFPRYSSFAHSAAVEPWIGLVILAALAAVPLIATYAVVFDRIVEVRVAVHAAAQYFLARYSLIGFTLVPFAALALLLFANRQEPIVALFSGPRPLLLGVAAGAGFLCLRLRDRWLQKIDRHFFRESYDARIILTRIVESMQVTEVAELGALVRNELETAVHAAAELFVKDETSNALRHTRGEHAPIAANTMLVNLAAADSQPMSVTKSHTGDALQRLPLDERQWLAKGGFELLVAIRRGNGSTVGLLALSAKRSGLDYSPADRRLIAAVAAAVGLALDNLRLRSAPETPVEPPAGECADCSRLGPASGGRCECGGTLLMASVPHVLRGVFRLKRRIGAGGMGVVYRAVDLNLGRDVAIKTLPRMTPAHAERLRREARAMASLTHPNLAVIHGIETWQGVPFLIEEYLSAGTLRDRLAAKRYSIAEGLDLAETLAAVLAQLHANGVVHCDVKPSNIGFTSTGVIKLLDFGLARLLHDMGTETASAGVTVAHEQGTSMNSSHGIVGTPAYMSPEAVRGERPRSSFDLWALAVLLFEAVSGRRPFDGRDSQEICQAILDGRMVSLRVALPDVPASVEAFLHGALAPESSQRPSDGAAFVEAVRRLRTDLALR